jgi:dTDP-4-dehydrorhamnose 3,5-epimerase
MNVLTTPLKGVLIIEPKVFGDNRGFFTETYHRKRYQRFGIDSSFVQDNLSFSVKHTLRGLHFQIRHPQAKLVQVLCGEVFDVVVDLRRGSSTFGRWEGVHLSEENKRQLFVPEGFAHGFCVLSDTALFSYKCSNFYVPEDEGGVLWSDPAIGIAWPVSTPIISEKDRRYELLAHLSPDQLPMIRG